MELSFYPPTAYLLAVKAASRRARWVHCKPSSREWPALFDGGQWNPSRPDLSNDDCFELVTSLIPQMGMERIQMGEFKFVAQGKAYDPTGHIPGNWVVSEKANFPREYSSFSFEEDYGLGSAQRQLTDETFHLLEGFGKKIPKSLDQLWIDKLFPISGGGLPPIKTATIKTRCSETEKTLQSYLMKSGKWEVNVEPDDTTSYRVQLKSHSDREFFYNDGYWWKADLIIEFWSSDGVICTRAEIYLYDSVVCGAPLSDDPDLSARKKCFQRIDSDSKAEVDLRDRVRLIIQKAYGASSDPP
jgi:hypothetical protein